MGTLDLSKAFIILISEKEKDNSALKLAAALSKVTAPLKSYAASLNLNLEELNLLHVCTGGGDVHPELERHVGRLDLTDAYKGQHLSRLASLIRALLRPEMTDGQPALELLPLGEQAPEPLRTIWPFLPRPCGISILARSAEPEVYLRERDTAALSIHGICLALAIMEVSRQHDVSSSKKLFEEYAGEVLDAINRHNHPSKWESLSRAFYALRQSVRASMRYEVIDEPPTMLRFDQLPEPLRAQVLLYQERAHFGFKTDGQIKVQARTKYNLDLSLQAEETITGYTDILCLGIGYLPREMRGEKLDVRDFLRLVDREVEVDEIIIKELYNPLVDYYRQLEQTKHSGRKEFGFDSGCFQKFIWAVATVAAFNGHLRLRQLFLKEYKVVLDKDSKDRHKRAKKETFDRKWLDGQIQRLRVRFKQIAAEGSFKNEAGGTLRKASRRNLNLCLFYVGLVTLRYLGVRQQCIRDCLLGKNIIFVAPMAVTFYWSEKETKNAKGVLHRLNMEQHGEVQEILIEAVLIYYKKIYPYLSGASCIDQLPYIREARRQAVAGQFFLNCNTKGICEPFTNRWDFYQWFKRMALSYLDFGTRLENEGLWLNPHFLRAVFGDWCRFDLRYSGEQTAWLAGDTEETFETDYITHPATYDATDAWTEKSLELRAERKGEEPKAKVKKTKKARASAGKGGRGK
jgi:hypothetical protein